ncbi:MAG: GNAT family N-acetyltransferase [Erythrobacter sp.]|jgi:GNAT superfamily N-acetyltransferase|uniref:GNAT family N-acetyltransferase n=1 Tax=Qipengyuania citrea TaxID=225971 RepID=UPI00209F9262|nr:GNAT family N-acetyltransferase [Qipengyuania citrea]MCP2018678.1 GNAT superfamily N-acetyltransferase [Qipengyuania citrea]MDE0902557.1 GNAT family N-acetyltransferase [Erythrobacter sp.]|tara:strand:- start:520 stop:1038 length:519 start_codon:yes stop_codon:yes gene_type:complete
MSEFSIRLARSEDAEAFPAVERAAAVLFADDPDCAEIDFDAVRSAADYRRLIARGHCLVAERGERIVGFLATQPCGRELHICEMDVHPGCQGQGIGAVMLRACLIDAGNAGFRAVTLTTFRDLPWNGPFYTRIGFVEVEDLAAHPRLAEEIAAEIEAGLPAQRRIAMIHFLG